MSIHERWRQCSSLEKVGLISFFISLPFVLAFIIDCSLSYFYEHAYKYQIAYCTFEDYIASENLEIKAQDYDFFWVPKTGNYEIVPKGMSRLSQEDGKYDCKIYAQSLWDDRDEVYLYEDIYVDDGSGKVSSAKEVYQCSKRACEEKCFKKLLADDEAPKSKTDNQ